jgi:hypothetical protein
MKFFIASLLVVLLFIDGKAVPLDAAVVSTNILQDPPAAYNVSVRVAWDFSSGINVTVVLMTIRNLKSSQYAAVGLGQNVGMVSTLIFLHYAK